MSRAAVRPSDESFATLPNAEELASASAQSAFSRVLAALTARIGRIARTARIARIARVALDRGSSSAVLDMHRRVVVHCPVTLLLTIDGTSLSTPRTALTLCCTLALTACASAMQINLSWRGSCCRANHTNRQARARAGPDTQSGEPATWKKSTRCGDYQVG